LNICSYFKIRDPHMKENLNQGLGLEDERCQVRVVHHPRVSKAKNEAIAEDELDRLALTFRILGDPTRLKMVMALLGGEMCVCDLAAFLNVSESAVSHQLRRLKDLALVKQRRDGKILYNALDDGHVCDLLKMGLEHVRE
jgi:DNA-binding transcriptional ArsR family regulator